MLMGRSARYATINQTITDDKITRQIKILNELLKRKEKKRKSQLITSTAAVSNIRLGSQDRPGKGHVHTNTLSFGNASLSLRFGLRPH